MLSTADTPDGALTRQAMGIDDGIALNTSGSGLDELRRDLQRLMDIEAIKQLKHAYFRCIDTANFDELATLLHRDIDLHFIGGNYEWKLEGRDRVLDKIRQSFHRNAVAQHNGHQPEIQWHSDTEATGIWYLADNMWILDHRHFTTGTVIYWDRYVKVDGRWQIRETRYRRIYEINQSLEHNPSLAAHYLATHGTDLAGDDQSARQSG